MKSAPSELSRAKRRVRDLSRLIDHHNFVYHTRDELQISDAEYDLLFRELLDLEAKYPTLVNRNSPTQKVGSATLGRLPPAPHSTPMLSLVNAFSKDDVAAFDERVRKDLGVREVEYAVEPKVDGLALSLSYEDGRLTRAATRGDGAIGELVTENVLQLESIPKELARPKPPSHLEVRGELYMAKEDFRRFNESQKARGEKQYANPRNLAAGSIRQLDSAAAAQRPLKFFAYSIAESEGIRFVKHSDALDWLEQQGLPISKERDTAIGVEGLLQYYERIGKERSILEYMIDGVVYKVNDLADQRALGTIARAPRFALAHKYPPERVVTTLVRIGVSVGRTGALTPVAHLEPVQVGGVTVTNATLHNEEEVNRKRLEPGRSVYVQRAGDVIPEVVEAVDREPLKERYQMPEVCPECGSKVSRIEGEAIVRCSGGLFCPAQLKRALLHFVDRRAMDIEGIGESLVAVLTEELAVKGPSDLYQLGDLALQWLFTTRPNVSVEEALRGASSSNQEFRLFVETAKVDANETLKRLLDRRAQGQLGATALDRLDTLAVAAIPKGNSKGADDRRRSRVGEKDAIRLRVQLKKSKSRPLHRFIFALGIPNVGEEAAKRLSRSVSSIEEFVERKWIATLEQKELSTKAKGRSDTGLQRIQRQFRGIGREIFESLNAFLSEPHNVQEIRKLLAVGVKPASDTTKSGGGPLQGKTFLFTGSLATMKRPEAERQVEELGGEVLSSVSRRLRFLVVGDIPDAKPSNKLERAAELGTPKLSETEFLELLQRAQSQSGSAGGEDEGPRRSTDQ